MDTHSPLPAILLLPLAFFLGAIPFGFIAGKRRGVDLREQGSKSIGATNTLRTLGTKAGVTVLVLDVAKGLLPVLAARGMGLEGRWCVAVGLCAVLGHIYSPFVRFRGGKGVATGLGVLIALSPTVAGITAAVFLLTVTLTRLVSLGSILAALAEATLFFFITPHERAFQVFGVVVAAFVIFRHRTNIARIASGTENRFGSTKPVADGTPAPPR
jgi:glycerol-3-phosphate acyltransferase PlsY